MHAMTGLNELREQGRMTWTEEEHGWVAAPEEIANALATDGFAECKRELTTSRRDSRPAGGVWQGLNTRTGSVASATCSSLSTASRSRASVSRARTVTRTGSTAVRPKSASTEHNRRWARERASRGSASPSTSGRRDASHISF